MDDRMPEHEVFAIRYAAVERRARDTFLHWRGEDRPLDLDFFFWVVRTEGRVVLVDTGFGEPSSIKRNRPLIAHPVDRLRALGIAPEDVSDVVLTHLHYDHAGNTGAFPRAVFHLQEAEMAFATGPAMAHRLFREHYEVEDVAAVLRLVHAGRVRFHDGTSTIAPGIRVHRFDGHTLGMQSVEVSTARGAVILTSDAIHYYANIEQDNPFPVVADVVSELRGYARLRELSGGWERLVPSHDPLVLARYPRHPACPDIACLHLAPTPTEDPLAPPRR